MELGKLLRELRPNVVWELVKWLLKAVPGAGVLTVLAGVYLKIKDGSLDWELLGVLFVISVGLFVYADMQGRGRAIGELREDQKRKELREGLLALQVKEPEEQGGVRWPPLQVDDVIGAIGRLRGSPPKSPLKFFATDQGQVLADTLVQIFRVSGWTVQHDLDTATYVFPLKAKEGVGVRVRYRRGREIGFLIGSTVGSVLDRLLPRCVKEEPFPDSDEYDYVRIDVGVELVK